ncbi:hypothetical protein ACLOJK_034845, partial [Asimina triloba]
MAEGERWFFFQLLEIPRRANRVEARREEAEKAATRLCSALEAARAELEVVRDDTDGIPFTKQDLEKSLAEAKAEVGALRLQKFSAEATFQPDRDKAIRKVIVTEEGASQSLVEPIAPRPKVEAFSGTDPDASKGSSLREE